MRSGEGNGPEQILGFATGISDRLGELDGVAAVALGGSWARGEARPDSDVDLGIYYDPADPPRVEDLRRLAAELDDRHPSDAVTDFGGWGPWINGGGWLRIEGRRVDWIYRDLELIGRIFEACRAGRPTLHHQPGHPHGFHTHIYLGEVHHCRPLHDPADTLRGLKALAAPYPPALKRALIRLHLWQAGFALDTTASPAARGDVFHAAGSFFQCVASLVQALYALNERYLINEKGALEGVEGLPIHPRGFTERASAVLARPGEDADELRASLSVLRSLLEEVGSLCAEYRGSPEASS